LRAKSPDSRRKKLEYVSRSVVIEIGALWRLTCMKAVAMITPDPKYFVMKKASGGTRMRFVRAAAMGRRTPA
jgi:hypothetical protein